MLINQLRLVEIELNAYCNRKCDWCPNKFIDRRSAQMRYEEMPDDIFYKILENLKEGEFKGAISFSRYNEPFANLKRLKNRVAAIKLIMPDNKLVTNTNGDYLVNENTLKGLLIDELTIMDYDCNGLKFCKEHLERLGVEIDRVEDGKFIHGQYKCAHHAMKILYYVDWPKHAIIGNRGGSLNEYNEFVRTKPCQEPLYFVGIDYNGMVMPCCEYRSDNSNHLDYILGNLRSELGLYHILNSKKAYEFRDKVANACFSGLLCKTCKKEAGRYTKFHPSINYTEED